MNTNPNLVFQLNLKDNIEFKAEELDFNSNTSITPITHHQKT